MHFCKCCNNMYYIKLSDSDNNKLSYYCRNCGTIDDNILSDNICVNKQSFNTIPFGIKLYRENQLINLIVFFFRTEIFNFFEILLILNFFLLFFSNSSHTTPVIFFLPNGTITKSPVFKFKSLS